MAGNQIVIAPSILSADFSRLGQEVEAVAAAGADWIHVDVMDGHFVPNLTIGPPVVAALQGCSKELDCHLMIEQPERYVEAFAQAGASGITVHEEACRHLHRNLQQIQGLRTPAGRPVRAGVAVNPHTPLANIEHVLGDCALVLVMTVNPGFGGQSLIDACVSKVGQVRDRLDELGSSARLQVDGGVSPANIARLAAAGADTFVAGSAVFGAGAAAYRDRIAALRTAAQSAR